MFGRAAQLRKAGVLGLNARNGDYIMRYNQRHLYPLVDDKILCKARMQEQNLAVPDLLGAVRYMRQTSHFEDQLNGQMEFVVKPANGSGGDGILVITGKRGDYYLDANGQMIESGHIAHHLTNVISGLYSLGGRPDTAMMESLVHFDPAFSSLTYQGVPDIRVIVYRGFPVMAMTRLPTRRSHGKANLHQGAIGAGIFMDTGITTGGVSGNARVSVHPDTGVSIAGFEIPGWSDILSMAARCYEAVGLGYIGVDIVLDKDLGPLILELNARPGLNIQIANRLGLHARLMAIDSLSDKESAMGKWEPQERIAWACQAFPGQ